MRFCISVALLASFAFSAFAEEPAKPPTALADYAFKKDDSFEWKLKDKSEKEGAFTYTLTLTSQTWQNIKWEHDLLVFIPKGAKPQETMLLWNQGGKASPTVATFGMLLAEKVGAPMAFLLGVPKQPLFEGKTEDALIAETFVKYLETKDASWPLLFPMVKSVVRAMDALQAFAKDELKTEVKKFVVTGASKRGWTSWLTAASGDKRVKAIAPMVIDTLNFPVQMKNQLAAFGKPSEMIKDYTERKLVPIPDTEEGKKLWKMVDPWIYRDSITVPKMIINGTNDPYWPQDALNTYWDDLKGEKYVCYVPNAGHNLRERDEKGKEELVPLRAVNTLAAFARSQVFDTKLPKLEWKTKELGSGLRSTYSMKSDAKPTKAYLWTAESETMDFRQSRWSNTGDCAKLVAEGLDIGTGRVVGKYRAYFIECEYALEKATIHLTTQIQILPGKK